MTGRGRPSTGTKIQTRIPPDQLAEIDADAREAGVTRAEFIRQIIAERKRRRNEQS